jgi:hypothetical protein
MSIKMANKAFAGISLGLCALAIVFTIAAFHTPNWTYYENLREEDNEYTWGLFRITDGPDGAEGISWDCLNKLGCEREDEADTSIEEDRYSGACEIGRDMFTAALTYWILHLVAIIFMVTYMIAQVAIFFNKDSGFWGMNYFQPAVWTVSSIVGFCVWWGLSEAEFDADCEEDDFEPDEKYKVCAESGMAVPIIAFIFMVSAGAFSFFNTKMQKGTPVHTINQTPVFILTPRIHSAILFVGCFAIQVFLITALVVRKWIYFEIEDADLEFEGSLFAVDKISSIDYYGYDCIAEPQCEEDDDFWLCKTFEPLYEGGIAYLYLELVNWAFLR